VPRGITDPENWRFRRVIDAEIVILDKRTGKIHRVTYGKTLVTHRIELRGPASKHHGSMTVATPRKAGRKLSVAARCQ
jgi:hypothetical protein